jgi:hypothetical protein
LQRLREIADASQLGAISFAGEKFQVIGRHHFLVKSKSELDAWHAVDFGYVDDDWPEGGCTCEGFQARKTCRHFRKARKLLLLWKLDL